MAPATLKTLMTIGAAVAGALALVPQLHAYQAAFTAAAGALSAWAHGKRPGDLTETQADRVIEAAVSQKVDRK